ncbi:hypothetical protein AJ80_04539 [Polytolypa hystricis UAMH7299]|uniref:Uncharacterized protein n=1 Tax=Polytolypa hystricis (strain UAMH7299) TaxID=1447883 RepID=A0A2B7YBA3_POLH7|nr:hypothetical protein AJ80_04539 [Polytolypa hystricis UAMH7299]
MSVRSSSNSSLGRKPPLFVSRSLEGLEKVIPPPGHSSRGSSPAPSWKFDKPLPELPHLPCSVYSACNGSTDVTHKYKRTANVDPLPPFVQSYPGAKAALSPSRRPIPIALDLNTTSILPRPPEGTRAPQTSPTVQSAPCCRNSQLSIAGTHCCEDDDSILAADLYDRFREQLPWLDETRYGLDPDQLGPFRLRTTPNSPSSHTMVHGVDPVLVPLPLDFKGLRRGANASEASLRSPVKPGNAGVGRGATSDTCLHKMPPPILRRAISDEAPRQRLNRNQHITWTASSTITLPSSSLSKEYLPEKDEQPNNASTPQLSPRSPLGNRTRIYSSSTDASLTDLHHPPHTDEKVDDNINNSSSDNNSNSDPNTPTTDGNPSLPHRRLTQPAIPLSECQKYGQSVWSSPKQNQKRRLIVPRFIHRLLPQQIQRKVTAPQVPPRPPPKTTSTARSMSTSAPSPTRHKHHTPRRRRPPTPSPTPENRTPFSGKGTPELGMSHTCRSMVSLTRDKFKMPNIEWRKGSPLKNHNTRIASHSERKSRQ